MTLGLLHENIFEKVHVMTYPVVERFYYFISMIAGLCAIEKNLQTLEMKQLN